MHRNYGKNFYRYFWCSEYGKFTKRPHYHVMFLLDRHVDYYKFVETCRNYWHFGFMFPRNVNGVYVDNKGRRTTPLLHHVQNACAYACKYITKDLDYYDLPLVKRYIDVRKSLPAEVRSVFNRYLPKHWQSKSIGSSYFSKVDTPDKMLHAIEFGVQNPTNLHLIQLPRYYVERFVLRISVLPFAAPIMLLENFVMIFVMWFARFMSFLIVLRYKLLMIFFLTLTLIRFMSMVIRSPT